MALMPQVAWAASVWHMEELGGAGSTVADGAGYRKQSSKSGSSRKQRKGLE